MQNKKYRWIGRLLSSGVKRLAPVAIKAAKSETGKAIKKAVKRTAIKSALGVAEDVANGENIKQSLKKNLKQGANSVVKDVTRLGVKQIKRKLDESSVSSGATKNQKKIKRNGRKVTKTQTGSGLPGTIFDC